jgi:glycolate oxidase iron-sulfur subunit
VPHHAGYPEEAIEMARRNIEAFADVDVIVTDIAGCGAMLKEYDDLLREDGEWAERGREFSSRIRDIAEVLIDLVEAAPPCRVEATATYHDACHLAHAQQITVAPRELLARIDGLKVIELPESDLCCGAAGTYNLTEPEMARQLGERKLRHIESTGAGICVTGNAGCAMQIAAEARRLGLDLEVLHPVDLLHAAYLGDGSASVMPRRFRETGT